MRKAVSNGKAQTPNIEDLAIQIEMIKGEIQGLTDLLGGAAQSNLEAVKTKAKQKVDDAGAATELALEELQKQVQAAETKTAHFVHEKPAAALGIAAGLGFLIGFIGMRR